MIDFDKAKKQADTIPHSDELLNLALMCSSFKIRPNAHKGITDEIAALAYDMACSRILHRDDKQKAAANAKLMAKEVYQTVSEYRNELIAGLTEEVYKAINADLDNHGELRLKLVALIKENS